MSLRSVVREDLQVGDQSILKVFTVRSISVVLVRIANAAGGLHPMLGLLVKQLNHALTGADIAWQAKIGPGLRLFHPTGVVVGPYVQIGRDCWIQQGVTIGGMGAADASMDDSPTIGDGVRLGAGCKVLGDISVGNHAVVGANAVVVKSVPAYHTATGVPAKNRPNKPRQAPDSPKRKQ